ncbi:DUF5667 domain-containing protein [Desulfosporosinus sp. Sb-LF]|uniref:DUF5667 domain-containing protein n=1 Tax=Desulfosporosinus sp. Sb-LF TaxID=2560027 RepID=UPI00107F6A70|nr:DUF5667 domain-containing protein [Desulfosporosinus sp. Sb-LF]TGE34510.1 hypothetical protein E4K68_02160 [Desulfosporosinus sp. Sb-LF]
MKKAQTMKKRMAAAVTLALLTLPLGSTLALADAASSTSTSATSTTTTTTSSAINGTTGTTTTVVDANGNPVAAENWFTELIGKIQLLLTFDPAKKALINENHAVAKLAEANQLLQKGDQNGAVDCFTEYSNRISQAQDFVNQINDPNSDAAKTLAIALSNVNTNNIRVLAGLLDKLPPQAAQRLALNIVRSMEKAVTKLHEEGAVPTASTTSTSATSTSTSTSTTTPPTTETTTAPATAPDTKALEKQAKIALKEFKKSLNKSVELHVEDQDQDEQDQDNNDQNEHAVNQTAQPSTPAVAQSPAPQAQAANQSTANQGTAVSGTSSTVRHSENSKKGSVHEGDSKEKKGGKENGKESNEDE